MSILGNGIQFAHRWVGAVAPHFLELLSLVLLSLVLLSLVLLSLVLLSLVLLNKRKPDY